MTFAATMSAIAVTLSAINAVILLLTYRRAGQWRESEEARAILSRLSACEGDLAGIKTRFENVSTKADVARLTAEVNGLEQLIKNTDAGVIRIEQILMRAHT